MIEKAQGYKVGQLFFPHIVEAQVHELCTFLKGGPRCETEGYHELAAKYIVEHKDLVIAVLTLTTGSHPRARKGFGARRKTKPAAKDNTLGTALEQLKSV